MQFPGFIGPSYLLDSVSVSAQRCVNLYPTQNEMGGKNGEVASLTRTPGLEVACVAGSGPNRGLWTSDQTGRTFTVSGEEVYEITGFLPVLLGTVETLGNQCSLADNGVQLLIVDSFKGYTYNFATNTFARITDTDFPVASHCCFIDQYLIVNDINTRRFYLSALSDATDWDGLDFASKEGWPDNLQCVLADHRELFLIGDTSSEVWFDTGDALDPFQRIQGAYMEFGTPAPDSVRKIDNGVILLHQDRNGNGMIYRINGYQGQRISTHAIEKVITEAREAGNDLSFASAWVYQQGGHSFYCINIPGVSSTWCYDVATGLWHERESWTAQGFTRSRAENHCVMSGYNVVGDYQNGNIYKLKKSVYSEAGSALRWKRAFPHLSKEMKRVFCSELRLDLENFGNNAVPNPSVALRISRDGGHTWSSEKRRTSSQGGYKQRIMWNKLGSSRDFVFEVSGSDAVPATLISAFLDVTLGAH
jgi:hypothetical protein